MIGADALLATAPGVRDFDWTDEDYRRYANCVGGDGILPGFPTVVAWIVPPTFTTLGVDPIHALHGAQRIDCHVPIHGALGVRVDSHIVLVRDKGAGRGAVITTQQQIRDRAGGVLIATLTTTCFGRREGGCGDAGPEPAVSRATPLRAPDSTVIVPTMPDLARRYSLTGDDNPLHLEPNVACAAGFERPVLHGLCSFGIAGRVATVAFPDLQRGRLLSQEARFTAPVYPGDTLAVDLWRDAAGVAFRVRVPARDVVAISCGYARID